MVISEKQIMMLITIAHAHIANAHRFGEARTLQDVMDLLATINDQQSEELKVIE